MNFKLKVIDPAVSQRRDSNNSFISNRPGIVQRIYSSNLGFRLKKQEVGSPGQHSPIIRSGNTSPVPKSLI